MADSMLPTDLYTAEQVRQLDQLAIALAGIPGIQLMKRAGRAAFATLLDNWPDCKHIIVCCGGGNNGGDGYVIAALAAQHRIPVTAIAATAPDMLQGDAQRAYLYAMQEGVEVQPLTALKALVDLDGAILVDALLGTGLSGDVRESFGEVINTINRLNLPVLAVDIPSGICSDTGSVLGCAVRASVTVSFIGLKQGLLTGRAPQFTGRLVFDDLQTADIENTDYCSAKAAVEPSAVRISLAQARPHLPERPVDAHKGLFGHVMVIGGDIGCGGAAAMAAEMAVRSGAGLTSVATRPEHLPAILARLPEVMVSGVPSGQALEPLLAKPSVLVVGPGLGTSPWSEQLLQQAGKCGLPLVVDADGLNLLARGRILASDQRKDWVLTPHPGEAARLLGRTVADIQQNRFAAARELQATFGGVIVLKGAGTVIACEHQVFVANVGNPGMASGGMGDVLAGLVGGLMAQGLSPLHAALLAVCAHGDAADLAVGDGGMRGMLATDLIPYIRELLN